MRSQMPSTVYSHVISSYWPYIGLFYEVYKRFVLFMTSIQKTGLRNVNVVCFQFRNKCFNHEYFIWNRRKSCYVCKKKIILLYIVLKYKLYLYSAKKKNNACYLHHVKIIWWSDYMINKNIQMTWGSTCMDDTRADMGNF